MKNIILKKIEDKTVTVGILGLGYVGLPLALRFADSGIKVIGFDIDSVKVDMLNSGKSYINHIPADSVKEAVADKLLESTTDFSRADEPDALIICVPTPLSLHREPDLSFITETLESILPYLRKGQLISLESTTYPGTTDEVLGSRIAEKTGFKIGEDLFLVYSPEREDPGNPVYNTQNIPKVIGGFSPDCLEVGQALYSRVIDQVVPVSSTRAAELTKLLENIYRAVNIGLVNELKIVADAMGLDIREVIDAAATKPFGFTPFYPGPGLGGHCIPIDPFYLTWKAKEYGLNTRFIELAGEINSRMPEFVVGKAIDALNARGMAMSTAKILILGLAYKKNVSDMRESPSVEIMEILSRKGAELSYNDPYIPVFPPMRRHKFELTSVILNEENLVYADCVIIATDHDDYDYELIRQKSSLIIDTRGVYKGRWENVVRA